MKAFLLNALVLILIFTSGYANAQDQHLYEKTRDSIIACYNRQDYTGIYSLADSAFKAKISQQALENFLAGNFSTGKFISSKLLKHSSETNEYLLHGQARDMILVLGLNSDGKFNSFGMKNSPVIARPLADIPTNNLKKTFMDLKLDSIAKAYFTFPQAAALSIGIIKDGKTFTYHYGQTDKTKRSLPTNGTGYQLASVSKTFTGTLLAQAVLEGKINLSDDIRKYLPGSYPNLQFEGKPITLVDLANHTSGLPAIAPNLAQQKDFDPMSPSLHYTEQLFFDALHQIKLNQKPGASFNYSNMGMSLVGLILEKVYGKSYDELLAQYITLPLGMYHTSAKLNPLQQKQMAIPYTNNGNIAPLWTNDLNQPAGGISSTLADMLKYLRAQLDETNPAIKFAHQPTFGYTGLAWGTRTVNGKRDLQHNGGGVAFRSNITVYPEETSGLVILMNNDCDQTVFNSLLVAIQRLVRSK